jgi:branched-chain amino acid aminotransferase
MNVFFVIEDVILTPDLSGRILHGVTRESAIQLLKEAGFIVEERPIEVSEIVTALKEGKVSEAFGCGTAATIAHISHIGHDADVYELPPVEGRKYSTFITDNLDAIKTGKLPDIHHWLETI